MLIPFVIEPDAIRQFDMVVDAEFETKIRHRSLIKLWRQYGVLLLDGANRQTSNFLKFIEGLPEKYRRDWVAVLDGPNPPICFLDGWQGEISPETLPKLNKNTMLALVDYMRAIDFELDESEFEKKIESNISSRPIFVCRAKAMGHSTTICNRESLSNTHILNGTLVQSVWDERFKDIVSADFVKQISIVDAYSVSRHFVPPQNQKVSGLEMFLSLVAKCATTSKVVKLYASDADFDGRKEGSSIGRNIGSDFKINEESIKSEFWNLWNRVPKGKFKKFEIIITKHKKFRAKAHDRFFRMDNYVWDIGSGLELFEGHNVSKTHAATFKSLPEVARDYREIEDDLDKDKTYVVDVLNV